MPNMMNLLGLLFLAQAAFALVIINNCPTPINFYDFPLLGEPIHPNFNHKKCLDVRDAEFSNGTPVQIYDCNGSPAQRWFIHPGSTTVQLAGTDFCLDGGSTPVNGEGLKIWKCYNQLPAQHWFYTGDHRVALEGQGFCVDLTGGDLTNGNIVQIWKCTNNDPNQVWTTPPPLKPSITFKGPQMQVILD